MKKKIGVAIVVAIVIAVAVSAGYGTPKVYDKEPVRTAAEATQADVVMPTKVSRPGCELEDRCYVPSSIVIHAGESVSWLNGDSAFHSVTSGVYGDPTGLFDSEYMDPGDVFTYTFDESGEYAYYCTLHEWMYGTVLVN